MAQQVFPAERIAEFALGVESSDLSSAARARVKLSILDALGCAIGALCSDAVRSIRALAEEFGAASESAP